MKLKFFVVTIKIKSPEGTKPSVRTICGDTVFCTLLGEQTATWTLKRETRSTPHRKRPK